MRKSIATVSLSGMLPEKLEAAAASRFDGVEIFENDLLQFPGTPGDVRRICLDLGLRIDMFQPFRDFEGVAPEQLQRNLDRAERKFDVMEELGTELILVCANISESATSDLDVRAERPELRIVDVPYRSLVQSPLATVAHIHDALGLPFDGRARERVTTLVRNRPQRKYGAHPYSLGEIGLTEGQVRDRFARYDAFCAGLATIDSAPDIA